MKNLARAHVPTVEAGSFPISKPPPPPPQPVSNLLPSDSVSNIGLSYAVASHSRAAVNHEPSSHNIVHRSMFSSTMLPASPYQQPSPTSGASALTTLPVPRLQITSVPDQSSHASPPTVCSNAGTTLVEDAVEEALDAPKKLHHGIFFPSFPVERLTIIL